MIGKITAAVEEAAGAITSGKLHLVGHSFGGAVAAAIAADKPSRVASVTLIAPIGIGKEINRSFVTEFVAAERRRTLQVALEKLFADPSKITSEMVEGTLQFKRLEGVHEALSAIADTIADKNGQVQSIGKALAGPSQSKDAAWCSVHPGNDRALAARFFCGPGRMLVCAYDRRIDQDVLDFRLACQCIHNSLPYALASPAREADVHRMPSSELCRQVAPWTASTSNPQHRFEKPAIVGCRSAPVAFLARQNVLDSVPYFIA